MTKTGDKYNDGDSEDLSLNDLEKLPPANISV